MSTVTPESGQTTTATGRLGPRRFTAGASLLARGDALVGFTAAALVICVTMIAGLLALIAWMGFHTFVPRPIVQLHLRGDEQILGEVVRTESFRLEAENVLREPPEIAQELIRQLAQAKENEPTWGERISNYQSRLKRDEEELVGRLETANKQLNSHRQEMREQLLDPYRRAEWLRGRHAQQLEELLSLAGTWRDRLTSIRDGIKSGEELLAYFSAAERPASSLTKMFAAPADIQRTALHVLLQPNADGTPNAAAERQRRYLRTGNFELTNEHFTWINDYQLAEQGETFPAWALIIERMTWGRFYGFPQSFHIHHPRVPADGERVLERFIGLLEHHAAEFAVPAPEWESLLQGLRVAQASARERAIAHFRQGLRPTAGSSLRGIAPDGSRIDLGAAPAAGDSALELAAIEEHWDGPEPAWSQFAQWHGPARRRRRERERLEKWEMGRWNRRQENARLQMHEILLRHGISSPPWIDELIELDKRAAQSQRQWHDARNVCDAVVNYLPEALINSTIIKDLRSRLPSIWEREYGQVVAARDELARQSDSLPAAPRTALENYRQVQLESQASVAVIAHNIERLKLENAHFQLGLRTADGKEISLPLDEIVRAVPANQLSRSEQWRIYADRWREFLTQEPREANAEGGVLPAIWGTVVMTLIMCVAVVPFGILAALYLREYARHGWIVSAIRVAINNLAGVPSIVFGVFGLGFFCYVAGAYIDGGPRHAGLQPLPVPHWWIGWALVGATWIAAVAVPLWYRSRYQEGSGRAPRGIGVAAVSLLVIGLLGATYLLIHTPFFDGLFVANLPNPTWGKGGIVWASLTLALLTLPVVIVSTEEALSAVPNSMREGSYACGASKWQTIRRIVLPQALPGIITGMILAMARGAGEVAPLMLVGALKLAPELPLDLEFPYLHGHRSFMHLAFHLFDLGFQSQNVDAAQPMVFTTTLLLIGIITALNVMAMWLRGVLRRRYRMGHF